MSGRINYDGPQPANLRPAAIAALCALGFLTLLSVIFYKERMLFTDAPHVIFHELNTQSLFGAEHRYGAYLTEAVPLILSKLHVPLRVILIAYSLSFNLLYLLIGSILFFRLRQYQLVLLMACYYTLFVSVGFYWTNIEIHQAVAFLLLCLGVVFYAGEKHISGLRLLLPFTVLSFLSTFTHPLLGVAFIFLWGFFILNKKLNNLRHRDVVLMSIIIVLAITIKLWISSAPGYDAMRMSGVLHLKGNMLKTAFSSNAAKTFLHELLHNYWWSVFLFFAGFIMMASAGKWIQIVWVLLSAAGSFMLVSLAFASFPYLYYLEGEWTILGIIIAAPFIYYVLPAIRPRIAQALLGAVFITRIAYIIAAGKSFTHRMDYIENMLAAMREKSLTKVVLNARDGCPEGILLQDWGLSTESTILSSLDGEYPQRTVCAIWPSQQNKMPEGNKEMVWNFDKRPVSALNPDYFAIDTTRPYVRMDYEMLTGKTCEAQ